jgi:hypothetical protein
MSMSPESQSGWAKPPLPGGPGLAFCPAAALSSAAFGSCMATTPCWPVVTSRPLIPIADERGMNLVRGSEDFALGPGVLNLAKFGESTFHALR